MGALLDIPMQQLEKIIYFAGYIVVKVDEAAKKKVLEDIDKEYKTKIKSQKGRKNKELEEAKNRVIEEVRQIQPMQVFSETKYHLLSLKYGQIFEATTGAEALRRIFEEINWSCIKKPGRSKYSSPRK